MTLKERLVRQIAHTGPLTIAQFMAAALYDPQHGYYSNQPGIGLIGDFITAPEVSQMFGELIGLWRLHEWEALGKPDPIHLIELGPGRGTLAVDALRAVRIAPAFSEAAKLFFCETNDALKQTQEQAIARLGASAEWRDSLTSIPPAPCLIVANEFFDCLPIRQFVRVHGAWRERMVGAENGRLAFGLARETMADIALIPPSLHEAHDGAIAEFAPALPAWIDQIAARFAAHPGRALIIDYSGDGSGDTLQSMRAHRTIDPLEAPGDTDLTAHVDFAAMARLARAAGLAVAGPVPQGAWLKALGVEARAEMLTANNPPRAARIAREMERLTGQTEMGVLFQVLCLSHPDLPAPAGF